FIEGCLSLLRDGRKRFRLIYGEVGKHLAIDFDLGLLQAVDDLAVAQSELTRGGVDAGDPERTEVALLGAAIAIRILAGLDDGLLGSAEYLAAGVVVALRLAQNFLVSCRGGDATFNSCHLCVLAYLVLGISWSMRPMSLLCTSDEPPE